MGGKCESDKGNPVGCKLIQKMSSDIQKIKEIRHPFSGWSILIIAALVVIIAGILLASTFKSNSYPTEIRLDVRVDGGGAVSEKAKANIKLELSEALLAMEARAAAAYNEKFATLLTILTIFGIAWPVIIALLQSKFNESELKKIENAQSNAAESLIQAREARDNAAESLIQAREARDNAAESLRHASEARNKANMSLIQSQYAQKKGEKINQKTESIQLISYRIFSQQYYDMGQDKRRADSTAFEIFNYYFARALEFRLRSFLLDERNIMVGSVTNILNELKASQSSPSKNIVCRNELTTCKSIAGEIMRNNWGTVREEEAKNIWEEVVKKYNEFGGSPPEGGEQ